ncbi:MAG TPA: peptidylprolyl isomerase [Euryarchaeota archaeon]|nr:peptidylprolyl isomerase [Euryarchaeota archaeon]
MNPDEASGGSEKPKIIIAEFSAWIEDTGELFETTDAELAKDKEIFDEKAEYEPKPIMIGKGRLFNGLEKSMLEAEIGKEYEVLLKPEEAAGPRDPKLVELFPIREFLKQDITPQVGLRVTVKNKTGYISAVTAGRVRVDFNNRLAGRTVKYNYKIVDEPKSDQDIFDSVLKMDFGSSEGFSAEFGERAVTINLPDVCKYDQRWLLSKYDVVNDLRDLLDLDTVKLIEEYSKAKKPEEPAEETSEEVAEEEKEESEELPENQTKGEEEE